MARNAKSRKLRNRKMRGGGFWCKVLGMGCTDAEKAEQAQAKAAAQTKELNDYSKHDFSNTKLGVESDPVPSHATPQGDGSSEAMTKEQQEQMRKSAADMLEAKRVSSSGKIGGGKSNRHRNKKSKKSRRTRRR